MSRVFDILFFEISLSDDVSGLVVNDDNAGLQLLRACGIGKPNNESYASSCLGDGEDGELSYDGFTVYTYRAPDGAETVYDVIEQK